MILSFLIFACMPEFPVPKGEGYPEDEGHDYDGDGFTEVEGDCDDLNADRFPENPEKGIAGMDMMNVNDEYIDITQYLQEGAVKNQADSVYYHGAKAHWLVDSIRKEGLWNPIQGVVAKSGDKFRLSIHPGGVRSGVFETMNDESLEMWIWDSYDAIPLPEVSVDDIIEWVKSKLTDDNHSSRSFG